MRASAAAAPDAATTPGRTRHLSRLGRLVAVLVTCAAVVPFSAFGLRQTLEAAVVQVQGPALVVDFVAYYGAGYRLLHSPTAFYGVEADRTFQEQLLGGTQTFHRFLGPPHAAALLTPFAGLPYGVAYLGWMLANLGFLVASARLLAAPGTPAWQSWVPALLLYLPVQQALVMGQLSLLMLLGFAVFVRAMGARATLPGVLALLPWSLKVQYLPAFLLVLVLDRRWRMLSWLLALILTLTAVAAVRMGVVEAFAGYRATSAERLAHHLARTEGETTGPTLLGLAITVAGPGPAAVLVWGIAAALVGLLVVVLWRRGLAHEEPVRWLQLAGLPLAATLAGPHSLSYDMTLWLGSAWLLWRYARARPAREPLVLVWILLACWAGAWSVVLGAAGIELGAIAGALGLALIGTLFHLETHDPASEHATPAPTPSARPGAGVPATR